MQQVVQWLSPRDRLGKRWKTGMSGIAGSEWWINGNEERKPQEGVLSSEG